MLQDEEEYCVIRPKIAIVRDYIGAVNDNPFLHDLDPRAMTESMNWLAADIETAACRLAEMTGVENTVLAGIGETQKRARAAAMLGHINGENALVTLSRTFMDYAAVPYFKLQDLEAEEKAGAGRFSCEKANAAMKGLSELHMLVKAIPAVYERLSAPAPYGAVA
ncbi:MAG TPA: hypothetical protein VFS88_09925 [Micavibrio sp.]|nr:hypothetical protein [Micavibrio sp.]